MLSRRQRASFSFLLIFSALQFTARAQSVDGPLEIGGRTLIVETVARGLNRPWGLAFLPSGDLLVSEKNGGLSRWPGGRGPGIQIQGLPEDLDQRVESSADNTGLFDIAVDPDFGSTRRVFLAYASGGQEGSALKVSSFELDCDKLTRPRALLLAQPRSHDRFHYGGRLLLLEDRTLLITSGERFAREKAQGPVPVAQVQSDLRGKILRIGFDGSVPADNPFVGKAGADERIYALGIRNSQGLARAADGSLWFSDHGPRRGDELNELRPGANFGWPFQTCGEYKDRDYRPPAHQPREIAAPAVCWRDRTYAPAGMAFYDSDAIPGWTGKLLVAGLSSGHLLLVTLNDRRITHVESLFDDDPQRLRDVAVAPDGSVYLAVDGENGRVVRLAPAET